MLVHESNTHLSCLTVAMPLQFTVIGLAQAFTAIQERGEHGYDLLYTE